jgi:hypothetical protein
MRAIVRKIPRLRTKEFRHFQLRISIFWDIAVARLTKKCPISYVSRKYITFSAIVCFCSQFHDFFPSTPIVIFSSHEDIVTYWTTANALELTNPTRWLTKYIKVTTLDDICRISQADVRKLNICCSYTDNLSLYFYRGQIVPTLFMQLKSL